MTRTLGLIRFLIVLAAFAAGSLALSPASRSAPEGSPTTVSVDEGLTAPSPVLPVRSEAPDRASDGKASVATTPVPRPRLTAAPSKVSPAPTSSKKPLLRPVAAGIHSPTLRGIATYYGTGGPGQYAAMGGFKDGTRVVVSVTGFHDGRTWTVTLNVVTQCGACRWRAGAVLIDLSIPSWNALGWPLSRGVIPVTVTILEGEYPT